MTQMQIAWQNAMESIRSNHAKELENYRHNKAYEDEVFRHNTVSEGELGRHNRQMEGISLMEVDELKRRNLSLEGLQRREQEERARHNAAVERQNMFDSRERSRHNAMMERINIKQLVNERERMWREYDTRLSEIKERSRSNRARERLERANTRVRAYNALEGHRSNVAKEKIANKESGNKIWTNTVNAISGAVRAVASVAGFFV
jgi:hypothetical protein